MFALGEDVVGGLADAAMGPGAVRSVHAHAPVVRSAGLRAGAELEVPVGIRRRRNEPAVQVLESILEIAT